MTNRLRRFAMGALLAAVTMVSLTACQIRYRHEVEPPGTPAEYTYGMGGFIRYDGYQDVAGDLEIPIVTYQKEGSNVTLEFVCVVHIADKAYYRKLQKKMNQADLVLYEGVRRGGEPGDVDPNSQAMFGAISSLLGLSGQLDVIDYDQPNWKQCDKITDEPSEGGTSLIPPGQRDAIIQQLNMIRQLKGSMGALLPLRQMEDFVKHQYATTLSSQSEGMNFQGMEEQIKQLRAIIKMFAENNEQARELDKTLEQLEKNFSKMETVIITERNGYLVKNLWEEVEKYEAKEGPQTIAVFYGAGHQADFHSRLRKAGWRETDRTWYKAWKINSR